MLVFLLSLVLGWRAVMFQFSGFYCRDTWGLKLLSIYYISDRTCAPAVSAVD